MADPIVVRCDVAGSLLDHVLLLFCQALLGCE